MIDTTEIIVGILADALDCPVSTDVPMERPARLAMVSLDGDERSDRFILRPIYSVTCWGTSDRDAKSIALSALHALSDASETHKWLSAVQLDTLARDEWGRNGQARYMLTVQTVFNTDE